MAKLTLSVDLDILNKAKRLAKANRTSVSAMFSQFVQSMGAETGLPRRVGPLTRRLTGLAGLPAGKKAKDVLTDALREKHGLER